MASALTEENHRSCSERKHIHEGSVETADPSAAFLLAKRRVGVSSGNWFEGSQVSKARPGIPPISPFDIASTLRYRRERMVCHFTESGARDDEGEGNITQGDEDTFGPTTTFI
jgi:hypothetical protein